MSESLLSPNGSVKSTRVDAAHDLMSMPSSDEAMPWLAMAGRDPAVTTDQLDRQTSELLGYVQKQNEELDARQAELNAKLAQLDNELRSARLRGSDSGTDLLGEHGLDLSADPSPQASASLMGDEQPGAPATAPPLSTPHVSEFEEVQQLVAGIIKPAAEIAAPAPPVTLPDREVVPDAAEVSREFVPPVSSVDSFPHLLSGSHWGRNRSDMDVHAMAQSLDSSELESERRLLADRKLDLDRRKAVLQRMQDETQAIHRESLEMRYVTEQLWAELSGQASADQINELLVTLRGRLKEHFATQEKIIDERKAEFDSVKESIEHKQEDVRQQSRKLQEWVESRHDELKSHAAEVEAREVLLDQREHRIRAEISKWEAQRAAYQQQIQGVMNKLNLSGIGG